MKYKKEDGKVYLYKLLEQFRVLTQRETTIISSTKHQFSLYVRDFRLKFDDL